MLGPGLPSTAPLLPPSPSAPPLPYVTVAQPMGRAAHQGIGGQRGVVHEAALLGVRIGHSIPLVQIATRVRARVITVRGVSQQGVSQ